MDSYCGSSWTLNSSLKNVLRRYRTHQRLTSPTVAWNNHTDGEQYLFTFNDFSPGSYEVALIDGRGSTRRNQLWRRGGTFQRDRKLKKKDDS